MSWLAKLFSKTTVQDAEEVAAEVLSGMSTASCLTVEAGVDPVNDEDENPTRQRRYFVKQGRFVDHEEERIKANSSNEPVDEIPDRHPVDLKSLFPKLSLR